MKYGWLPILSLVPATACVIVAGYLAIYGIEGWGWFLFVAFCLGDVSWYGKDDSSK